MQHEELDTLLAPISEELPAGEDLRFEGTYDRIQESRREDDASLPQGIWQTALKKADWDAVERESLAVLSERSKDIQIAVWLLEARICLYGIAGFRSGLGVLDALCESFWEELYPRPEEGSLEYRLLPIEWMNEKLGLRLKRVPITSPVDEDGARYSWADLEMARRLENIARKAPAMNGRKDGEDDGVVTMVQFEASRMATPAGFYRALRDDLTASMAELDRFSATLRLKCGNEAPSLERLRVILLNMQSFVEATMEEGGVAAEDVAAMEEAATTPDDVATDEAPMDAGETEEPRDPQRGRPEFRSRSEAYATLSAIADYLMKIEPHSPTPYLIRRAVSWGSMPLIALLQELMEEGNNLAAIYKLLGIREPG